MRRVLLFLLINQTYCFPIRFICWANSNGYDAPIFNATNLQTSFIMTKNDVTVNVTANYPFYNSLDYSGFGIRSGQQHINRIDERGGEYLTLRFSSQVNLTFIDLGGFIYPHQAILALRNYITSSYYFLSAPTSSTNSNANSILRFTFNPPITVNYTDVVILFPSSESLFSFNSFTIDNLLARNSTTTSPTTPPTTSPTTSNIIVTTSNIMVTTSQSTISNPVTTSQSNNSIQSTSSNIMITTGDMIIESKDQPTSSNKMVTLIVVGIVLGICCIIGSVVGIVYVYRCNRRKEISFEDIEIDKEKEKEKEKGKEEKGKGKGEEEKRETRIKVNALEKNDIKIGELIGNGHFGKVYHGKWQDSDIALKTIAFDDKKQLMDELEILSLLNHVNIVRLFGIYKEYIVMEYVSHGNVIQYIQKEHIGDVELLIKMSKQICSGMIYLQENNIIHRDLAARNILIDLKSNSLHSSQPEIIVKISDFGLSRFVLTGQYISSNAIFPIRWTAPETIDKGHFSYQSDVWSFGIVLWEIFSHGQVPYYFMTNAEVIKFVVTGNHLEKPTLCPDSLFSVIIQMWHLNPLNRPSFANIYTFLKSLIPSNPTDDTYSSTTSISSDYYQLTPRSIR